jgi:hypothetical protein
MTLTKTTDHEGEGVELLLEQFKDKQRFEDLLKSYLAEVQAVEDAAWQLYLDRAIDNAIGVQLDKLGEVLLQPRFGLGDPEYRVLLKARVLVLRSSGTADELIGILQQVLGDSTALEWRPKYPAHAYLRVQEQLDADPDILAGLLQDAKSAGVAVTFGYHLAESSKTFQFSAGSSGTTDTDAGFAPLDRSTGGEFAGALREAGSIDARVDGLGILHDWRTGHVITDASNEPEIVRSLDASREGWHLEAPTTAAQPTLLTSDPDFNGRVVQFDGSDNYLEHPALLEFGANYFRVFLLFRTSTSNATMFDTSNNNSGVIIFVGVDGVVDANVYDTGAISAEADGTTAADDGVPHLFELHWDPVNKRNEIYLDGVLEGSAENGSMGDVDSSEAVTLGARSDDNFHFDGVIGAIAIFSRDTDMTDDELTRVRDALGSLY